MDEGGGGGGGDGDWQVVELWANLTDSWYGDWYTPQYTVHGHQTNHRMQVQYDDVDTEVYAVKEAFPWWNNKSGISQFDNPPDPPTTWVSGSMFSAFSDYFVVGVPNYDISMRWLYWDLGTPGQEIEENGHQYYVCPTGDDWGNDNWFEGVPPYSVVMYLRADYQDDAGE